MLTLPTRILARSGAAIASVVPRTTGANWMLVDVDDARPMPIAPSIHLVARMDGQLLNPRNDKSLASYLAAINRSGVDILLLDHLDSSDLKIGWPTHRLQQYRDRGWFAHAVITAPTISDAEWMIENASVAGVVVPFGSENLDLRYRSVAAAQEAGMAVLCETTTLNDLRFALSHPFIVSAIHQGSESIDELISAVQNPLSTDDIESAWQTYRATHEEPKKLRGNHPPEFGA